MRIALDDDYDWRRRTIGDVVVHYRGDAAPVKSITDGLKAGGWEKAQQALRMVIGHFATIVEGPGFLFASVDHCRSIPIFFCTEGTVSNSADLVRSEVGLNVVDDDSVLEATMAGYVSGSYTLFQGLRQLQAGESLYWDAATGRVEVQRYYTYLPTAFHDGAADELVNRLGGIVDRTIERVIGAANGTPIWVPLSGGLDSRLVLCKLVERGYDNLHSFSYGPPGNDDAKVARRVAGRLNVPWQFLPSRRADMRRFFASNRRRDYWRYASGLCSIPNPQDILPLMRLMGEGRLREDDFVVNGQTGDFISGGHIPSRLLEANAGMDDLIEAIIDKHYSLWRSLKTPENLARIEARILGDLDLERDANLTARELAAHYERWEYHERQAKYIVNGQRIYDFLGLNWALPWWDREYVEFWQNLPASTKAGQAFYLRYLDDYDYKGLFREFKPHVWHWPGLTKVVLPMARLIRLALGYETRDRFLNAMRYFGMYRHLYAPYGFLDVLRRSQDLRNPLSLLVLTWLREIGVATPRGV